jgi:hypothetical protein
MVASESRGTNGARYEYDLGFAVKTRHGTQMFLEAKVICCHISVVVGAVPRHLACGAERNETRQRRVRHAACVRAITSESARLWYATSG